jgi:hypothetical protein
MNRPAVTTSTLNVLTDSGEASGAEAVRVRPARGITRARQRKRVIPGGDGPRNLEAE